MTTSKNKNLIVSTGREVLLRLQTQLEVPGEFVTKTKMLIPHEPGDLPEGGHQVLATRYSQRVGTITTRRPFALDTVWYHLMDIVRFLRVYIVLKSLKYEDPERS